MKFKSCRPNPLGRRGFIWGWEKAFLGNCLSSFANLVAFSIRTGVPAIYPQVDDYQDVFRETGRMRRIFDPSRALNTDLIDEFSKEVDELFDGYYSGYVTKTVSTPFHELPNFPDAQGLLLFLPHYELGIIRDWSDNGMEANAARFCSSGNGLIYPSAYWNQYTDMRMAAVYGPILRQHLGPLRDDGALARVAHMEAHANCLKIGIHIRQSDTRNWHGGAYYYEIDTYKYIMRHIHDSLGLRPHVFYVFSEMQWSAGDFEGLPVFYEKTHFNDDFVSMGTCDYVVGPPSTFATWSAFMGGAKRVIVTAERLSEIANGSSLLDHAVEIPFPTGSYLPGDPQARPI